MEWSPRADGPGRIRQLAKSVMGTGPLRPLVAVHVISSAANAMFTVSLAGSLFFGVSVDAARPRVLFYLLLTMAPFAIVAPFLGPFTDRVIGGYRMAILLTAVGRGVACGLLVAHLSTLLLFPEAFAVLVLGKTYSVAKSALVPQLVEDPGRFLAANALLARASSIGGVAAGGIGALVLQLVGAWMVVALAGVLHLAAAGLAFAIPTPGVPPPRPKIIAELELHNARLTRSAAVIGALRFTAGYAVFMIAIDLKATTAPAWVFGVILLAAGLAGFGGSMVAGVLRTKVEEESVLAGALFLPGAMALLAGIQHGRASAALVAASVGFAGMIGVHTFDSLAQRLAPDAERGRTFARFETRFQLAWVLGAMGPVLFRPPAFVGFLVLGATLLIAFAAHMAARRTPTTARSEPIVIDRGGDPAAELLALGKALHERGSHRLAVLVAVEAGRVAAQATGRASDHNDQLEDMWRLAAAETADSPEDAERAIRLVAEVVALSSGNSTAVHSSSVNVTEYRTEASPDER